ncbi:O-methyltransferase [Microbacterium sp. YY-03]|uniref:O-methyltransferase n=1 Tax=Microbacterium sp. YY-03 TaxID=3421636 RepID=UPI003D18245C
MNLSSEATAAADAYLQATLIAPDDVLENALARQRGADLPDIEVTALSGKLLNLLIRMSGAKRVLEIGTLGAYSTIWMARAVGDDGHVTTIEAEPDIAKVAQQNLNNAGVAERVEIKIGRGEHVLPTLVGAEPYDFVFIDADKESNTLYLDYAVKLGRSGTVVVVDNIGREGEIVRPDTTDPKVQGTRAGLEMLGRDPRFDATAFQTVGSKGWDGTAIAVIV